MLKRRSARRIENMSRANIKLSLCSLVIGLSVTSLIGQPNSGGNFTINKSVISAGGDLSTNGAFSITGTVGQPLVEMSISPSLTLNNGFWTPETLFPTAAGASISGRVIFGKELGVTNATVYLITMKGLTQTARTNQFGYFMFEDIEVGQLIILSVFHKHFQFTPQTLNLTDAVTGLNIPAQ